MPADDATHELLLRELGRINSDLSAQRRLSATTLHDLAAPTQVVLGLAETLLDHSSLDEVARVRVEQLHRSAQTMASLIAELSRGHDLDDVSRLDLRRLDLAALVSSVVERTRVLAAARDITVLHLGEQTDERGCWVDGDALKLERALSNVLGNAIKYSPQGSQVSVAVDRGVDHVLVSVQDEGPGIPAGAHDRIFEAHQRHASGSDAPGSGLGLYIARQVAHSHGGRITVSSATGQGATFLLEVPLALDEAYADPA